jgi:hypothetical protein
MQRFHEISLGYQSKRWRRHDARLWLRPDAHRFQQPGAWREEFKNVVAGQSSGPRARPHQSASDQTDYTILIGISTHLLSLKRELFALKANVKWRRLLRAIKSDNPDQARVPAGNPDGGQWTSEGASGGFLRFAQREGIVRDAFGDPYYNPGGHHEIPQAVYGKWKLRPETLRVFNESTTGTVPDASIRAHPNGAPVRHYWGGAEAFHKQYNVAAQELADRFLERNKINPEDMTPDQARAMRKEVRLSDDPRIRDYSRNIRLLRRLFRVRHGAD